MDPESKIESEDVSKFVVTKVQRKAVIIRCLIVRLKYVMRNDLLSRVGWCIVLIKEMES